MSDREYVCGRLDRVPDLGVSRRAAPVDPAAEKGARTWLEEALALRLAQKPLAPYPPANVLRVLAGLLAEPRLPAEPDQATVDAMARGWYRGSGIGSVADAACAPYGTLGEAFRRAWADAYAHLTKPATKTVEVWHVEYVVLPDLPAVNVYRTHAEAQGMVDSFRDPAKRCARVTGPHKQEVPNG